MFSIGGLPRIPEHCILLFMYLPVFSSTDGPGALLSGADSPLEGCSLVFGAAF